MDTTVQKYPQELLAPVQEFLESQLKFLELQKNSIESEDPYSDLHRPDSGAEDLEQFEHDKTQAISDQLEDKIAQTKHAISRIESGEYGFCDTCSNMINTDRLAIYPEATQCIQCQQKQENK